MPGANPRSTRVVPCETASHSTSRLLPALLHHTTRCKERIRLISRIKHARHRQNHGSSTVLHSVRCWQGKIAQKQSLTGLYVLLPLQQGPLLTEEVGAEQLPVTMKSLDLASGRVCQGPAAEEGGSPGFPHSPFEQGYCLQKSFWAESLQHIQSLLKWPMETDTGFFRIGHGSCQAATTAPGGSSRRFYPQTEKGSSFPQQLHPLALTP